MKSKVHLSRSIVLAAAVILAAALPARAGDLAAAKAGFTTFCVKCHGDSGKGDGAAAATLKTKPRDFTSCAQMTPLTDDTLFKVIKDGGVANSLSADMPAWKDGFEDPEIKDLVAYVRSFCKN